MIDPMKQLEIPEILQTTKHWHAICAGAMVAGDDQQALLQQQLAQSLEEVSTLNGVADQLATQVELLSAQLAASNNSTTLQPVSSQDATTQHDLPSAISQQQHASHNNGNNQPAPVTATVTVEVPSAELLEQNAKLAEDVSVLRVRMGELEAQARVDAGVQAALLAAEQRSAEFVARLAEMEEEMASVQAAGNRAKAEKAGSEKGMARR